MVVALTTIATSIEHKKWIEKTNRIFSLNDFHRNIVSNFYFY